jgi:mono/diheme cytochrome c family protein
LGTCAFWIAAGVGGLCAAASPAADAVEFSRQIRPILANNCFACHGPDDKARQADLRLDLREAALGQRGGPKAIIPGDSTASPLIQRITATDADERMPPPGGKKLTPAEIDLLTRWVREGAKYSQHWSYVRPVRPPLPQVHDRSGVKNPIDAFVLARLEREGLGPSPAADRLVLVRRVALTLTGLPPTLEEVDRFVKDASPDAYERLVDRLLDQPSYGEHWGRMWLDLARYADSVGYVSDEPREIWAYRDYVIRSFNANKPFDRFTIEQLAGDVLPNPTEEQIVATAFHRNTPTNNEGGTDDEEFRNVAVVDRVNTTMSVWMGTTMACAQCHNHKYDPITQQEYFQFFAFFNNTEDADRPDEQPLYSFYLDDQKRQRAGLEAEIAALESKVKPPAKPTDEDQKRLKELKDKLAAIKPHTVPILRELPPDKRRTTFVHRRGNFLDHGPQVAPGVPAIFPPLAPKAPANRLGLAQWLVDERNPLTARVVVNWHWEKVFGTGIVATGEDFGVQGEAPSHPELLDWLAVEVVEKHWDLKYLVRMLVTSAAFRQSSRVTPETLERDPDNRLLARGPRFRLDAEVIRDEALAASGLLSRKMFGPSVRPVQPSFGLTAAFGGGMDWQNSEGEDAHRRGLYTTWRRTNPYPSMMTFDAAGRETCTVRRTRTNTPLQALVTLNDPVYVEAAQALARRMVNEGGSTSSEKARYGFRLCVSRPPSDAELARLVQLHEEARSRYAKVPEQAQRMATVPLGKLPPGADAAELAAWTVVGNVLLNLDEMFMAR